MKRIKTIFFTTALTFFSLTIFGQWNFDNQNVIYSNNSNVGIGTNDPWYKLQVIGTVGIGKFATSQHAGLLIDYVDDGSGTTVFKHQRWGGNFFFKRNDAGGERTQLFFGGAGNHYMDIYNNNNEVKVRFNTGGDSYFNGGNLGIGTTSPFYSIGNSGLNIDNGNHSMLLFGSPVSNSYGGVVQTSDNKHRVFIGANLYDDPSQGWKNFQTGKGGAGISVLADNGNWGTSIDFYTSNNNNEITPRMTINGVGNVGIGTLNPNQKLTVKGTIYSTEVKVDLNVPGPDYVFEENYNLLSLSEVEKYIKQNKHLPEVPSANEMEANGINLSEMNMILLKKLEELTLHVLELKKEVEELKKK